MIFTFDEALLKRIWNLADAITRRKMFDLTVKKVGVNPAKKTFMGLRAQYAVNEVLGSPFDWRVYDGSDDGIDGTFDGKTYQVKYSQYTLPNVYLAFSKDQPLIAELAILVIPAVTEKANMNVRIYGYIDSARFFELARKKAWGTYTAEKAVHNSALTPFTELFQKPEPKPEPKPAPFWIEKPRKGQQSFNF